MTIVEKTYKWNGTLLKRTKSTNYIVLHNADAVTCSADDIHRWHLDNGWAGIGYHFFIRKDGSIYRGRPIDTVGAQCKDYNGCSIGICFEGKYASMDKTMPQAQKQAGIELLKYLKENYYPNAKVVGHRDLNYTDCPGQNFPMDDIVNGAGEEEKSMSMSIDKATEILKDKVGLSDETIQFLLCYKYGADLIIKIANTTR